MHERTDKALQLIKHNDWVSTDTETSGTDPYRDHIAGIVVGTPEEAVYLPIGHFDMGHGDPNIPHSEIVMVLDELEKVDLVMHEAAFDQRVFVQMLGRELKATHDTLLMAYSTGRYFENGLKELVQQIFHYKMATFKSMFGNSKIRDIRTLHVDVATPYAEDDGIYTAKLFEYLSRTMDEAARTIYNKIEMPTLPHVVRMMDYGLPLNKEFMQKEAKRLEQAALTMKFTYAALIADRFGGNLQTAMNQFPIQGKGSMAAIKTILFDQNYLALKPLILSKKTQQPSTGEDALKVYRDDEPIVNALLSWREISARIRNYIKYADMIHEDGRLRPSINQHGASSGRFSTSDPNVQNWSKYSHWTVDINANIKRMLMDSMISKQAEYFMEEDTLKITENFRDSMQAPDGFYILRFDYEQIEYRILQGYIQNPDLRRIFDEDGDIHINTAEFCFQVAEVSEEMRNDAKTINYALNYGMAVPHFYRELKGKYTMAETSILHGRYFQLYPEITIFHNATRAETDKTFAVSTYFGRYQLIPEYFSTHRKDISKAQRAGVARKVQGTAADIMKIAIIRVGNMLRQKYKDVQLILTVHDELILLVPNEITVEDIAPDICEQAEIAIPNFPPLPVDFKYGDTWGSKFKYKMPRAKKSLTALTVELKEGMGIETAIMSLKEKLGEKGDTSVTIQINGQTQEMKTQHTLQELVKSLNSSPYFTLRTEYT